MGFSGKFQDLCGSPCVVFAHSLGAMLSLGAIPSAANAKALVIFSGFAKFAESADNPYGQPLAAIDMMKKHLADNPAGLLRNFYRSMFHPVRYAGRYPTSFNINCLSEGMGLLESGDFRSSMESVTIPVLLLHGKKDRIVDFRISEELASKLPSARLKLFEDAGHALPFTHTLECLEHIEGFLHDI